MKLRWNNAGFTLPETMIAITLTSALIVAISGYMLENMQQSTLTTARAALQNETEQSLDLVANDIRQSANADSANRWADNNSPGGTNNVYGWASNASTIILATGVQNTSGNIVFSDQKNYITQKDNQIYFVKNNTLYKRILAAPVANNSRKTSCPSNLTSTSCPADRELLHNVSLFSVQYLDAQNQVVTPSNANSIELHIRAGKTVYGKSITSDYTTRMVFRN